MRLSIDAWDVNRLGQTRLKIVQPGQFHYRVKYYGSNRPAGVAMLSPANQTQIQASNSGFGFTVSDPIDKWVGCALSPFSMFNSQPGPNPTRLIVLQTINPTRPNWFIFVKGLG